MRFIVRIDDKAWAKHTKRLERQGIVGDPAEILEALIATSLTGEDSAKPLDPGAAITSTSIMLTLGRITVEQVPERDELSSPGPPPDPQP